MTIQFLFSNNAITTLAGPISATATTMSVAAGMGILFPQPSLAAGQVFTVTLVSAASPTVREIVRVTAVSTDTFTILRAQEGTAALAWNAGDTVDHRITAGWFDAMTQNGVQQIPSTTFYVSASTGNDSNPGTSALPFLTLQGAVNYISQYFSSSPVTINIAAGAYAGFTINGYLQGQGSASTTFGALIASWNFVGASASAVTIQAATGAVNGGWAVNSNGAVVTVSGATLTGSAGCATGNFGGTLNLTNCNFVGTGTSCIGAQSQNGNILFIRGSCQYSGSFYAFWWAGISGGNIELSDVSNTATTLTFLSGTTVSYAGAFAYGAGQINVNAAGIMLVTPSNVTGGKYYAIYYGIINTGGAGVSYLPGSVAGSTGSSPGFGAYL